MQEPITREEMYLASAAGYDVELPEPITRKEIFLAKLAGMDVETPAAFTRREMFIENAANNRTPGVVINNQDITINENGEYTADEGYTGLGVVTVEVPDIPAVTQPLEITENGTYTAQAGVDGYNPVVVNIPDPTKTVILEEQQFGGFSLNETYGYAKIITPPPFVLVEGETYYVVWDGETYETTAQAAPAFGSGSLCLGNGVPVGASGNGEPFVIGYMASAVAFLAFTDNRESHTVGIWQKVTQEIKLQDKTITENGEYTADSGFDGLGKVTVEVAGSGGGSSDGAQFMKLVGKIVTNTNKLNVDTTVTIYIPKNAKIIRAWGDQAHSTQGYYPYITSVSASQIDINKITVDTTAYTYCDKLMYTFKTGFTSTNSAHNIYAFKVLLATDAITVKNAGDGLYAGTLNRCDTPIYLKSDDMGVEQIMYLKSLDFAEKVTDIPAYTCYKQVFLEQVDLCNVKNIGDEAFLNCTSLKQISLNPELEQLGSGAFSGCSSLTGELIIPNAITVIPNTAFSYTKFDRVVFPAGLMKITYNAFTECTQPTEYDFSKCTSIPELEYYSSALGKVGNGQVLKIPSALFNSWSTATNWKDWAAQMVTV